MGRLQRSHFLDELPGRPFLSRYDAIREPAPEILAAEQAQLAAPSAS